MNNNLHTYRKGNFYIIVVYIYLLFYASFSHHQHKIYSFGNEAIVTHSHASHSHKSPTNKDENHDVNNNSDYWHLLQKTTPIYQYFSKTRIVSPNNKPIIFQDFNHTIPFSFLGENLLTLPSSIILGERYVLSAANTSPPSI